MLESLHNYVERRRERRRTKFIRRELNKYVRCPTCGSRRLYAYPFGVYSTTFKCAHGHRFSKAVIDDLCP